VFAVSSVSRIFRKVRSVRPPTQSSSRRRADRLAHTMHELSLQYCSVIAGEAVSVRRSPALKTSTLIICTYRGLAGKGNWPSEPGCRHNRLHLRARRVHGLTAADLGKECLRLTAWHTDRSALRHGADQRAQHGTRESVRTGERAHPCSFPSSSP
jgi:hypothetical protein